MQFESLMLILGWCDILVSIQRLENDRKMMKITISPEFVGLPWQRRVPDGNFKYVSMDCSITSFSCKKIINLIRIKEFSH